MSLLKRSGAGNIVELSVVGQFENLNLVIPQRRVTPARNLLFLPKADSLRDGAVLRNDKP
jgi:hypothetical protein